jgi:uncharacterized membrane protein SpoIIM required for sporulation
VALYQQTTTHLSEVRSAGQDPVLVAALSSRVARARAAVVGASAPGWDMVGRFALISFPAMAYRARWWWLGTASGSLVVAFVIGWWVARSPQVQAALLPQSQVSRLVQHRFQNYYSQYAATSFAAQVWTHNVWVAAEALIFGIVLGLPTLWLLFSNASNVGVIGGLMIAHGKGVLFFALIVPFFRESPTSARGRIRTSSRPYRAAPVGTCGRARLPPGDARWRAGAARRPALGLIVVFLTSGLIEAFVTPSPLATWARSSSAWPPRPRSSAT